MLPTVRHTYAQTQPSPPPRRHRVVDAGRRAFLRQQLRIPARVGLPGIDYPTWRPRTIHRCVADEALRRAETQRRDDWLPRYQRGSVIRHDAAAADATYRQRRCQQWISRTHWLEQVVPWTIAQQPDVLRRHNNLSAKTFIRVLTTLTLYAHRRTGRNYIARPHIVAPLAGVSERTIQYVHRAAEELGLVVELFTGGMLTWDQRCEARREGSRQRGLSTVRAFVMPQAYVSHLKLCTPPRGTLVPQRSHLSAPDNSRCATATRPAPPAHSQSEPPRPARRRRRPRGFTLAIDLVDAIPWLRGVAPGRIATSVTRYAIALHPWSAAQLVDAMTATNRRLHYKAPEQVKVSPFGLLHWYLSQIDAYADHPRTADMLERQHRAAAAAAARAAHAQRRRQDAAERAAAAPPAKAAQHLATARAELARRRNQQDNPPAPA